MKYFFLSLLIMLATSFSGCRNVIFSLKKVDKVSLVKIYNLKDSEGWTFKKVSKEINIDNKEASEIIGFLNTSKQVFAKFIPNYKLGVYLDSDVKWILVNGNCFKIKSKTYSSLVNIEKYLDEYCRSRELIDAPVARQ